MKMFPFFFKASRILKGGVPYRKLSWFWRESECEVSILEYRVECLPTMLKALGSVPVLPHKRDRKMAKRSGEVGR